MNQPEMNNQPNQVQIKATDEKLKGEYANAMQVLHTKEEFVLDFLSVFPPSGTLNSRVILSPSHYKRMVKALQENMKLYEDQYGNVEEVEGPSKGIGFQA